MKFYRVLLSIISLLSYFALTASATAIPEHLFSSHSSNTSPRSLLSLEVTIPDGSFTFGETFEISLTVTNQSSGVAPVT